MDDVDSGGDSIPVARGHDESDADNTLDRVTSIFIHLAIPSAEASKVPGSFRVRGSGGYDQIIAIANHFVAAENAIGVWFQNIPPADNFSLSHIGSDGSETVLIQDVPYQTLKNVFA